MRRRALLAAGLAVLTAGLLGGGQRAPRKRPPSTVHTGPARTRPWHPGAVRPQAPDWLYENGMTTEERITAAKTPCACSRPEGHR